MCIKRSDHHCCLQGTLVFLLVLCVLLFGFIVAIPLGVYYLTESSTMLGREQRHLTDQLDEDTMFSSQSELHSIRTRRQIKTQPESFNDLVANYFFVRNCSINQWIVHFATLFDICNGPSESFNNIQFNNCLRDAYWYIGIAALVPFCLSLFSLIAVCRLWLCPVITLAVIYLGLGLALISTSILYKSGEILTTGWPLFLLIIALVCLYALLSFLHILLFALVTCQRKHSNGDNEKIMKMSDEDDEIDDPNVPLYKNGLYSPQKRTDFDDKIKDFKYIDDDMSYVFRRG